MSVILSFCMYYLSFLPLWLTILFIDIKSIVEGEYNKYTELVSIISILIMLFFTIIYVTFYFRKSKTGQLEKYEIVSARESKTITAEFLLSYILPLFAFDFRLWDQVVEFLIFFVILGLLCIRHNNFSVNIVLEIINYKIYECELKNNDGIEIDKIVISKNILNVKKGFHIDLYALNNDVLLDNGYVEGQF